MIGLLRWAPAMVFSLGAGLVHGLAPQRAVPLLGPLDSVVPTMIDGYVGVDQEVGEQEARVAGFSDYLLRAYQPAGDSVRVELEEGSASGDWVGVYVAYYESQTQGQTIHSPKNCMPGSGWEPLQSRVTTLTLPGGAEVEVNRYVLQRKEEQALVLYWYQGRGRVGNNEYRVKFDLLRDAALSRRSDEALVRIVVPVRTTEEDAFDTASVFASTMIPALYRVLAP